MAANDRAVLGRLVLSPQGGPAAKGQHLVTTLVRIPDQTWKLIEKSLDSSFSQFQYLEITAHALQGVFPLPVVVLLTHRFSSLKTLTRPVFCRPVGSIGGGCDTFGHEGRIFPEKSLSFFYLELPFADLAGNQGFTELNHLVDHDRIIVGQGLLVLFLAQRGDAFESTQHL